MSRQNQLSRRSTSTNAATPGRRHANDGPVGTPVLDQPIKPYAPSPSPKDSKTVRVHEGTLHRVEDLRLDQPLESTFSSTIPAESAAGTAHCLAAVSTDLRSRCWGASPSPPSLFAGSRSPPPCPDIRRTPSMGLVKRSFQHRRNGDNFNFCVGLKGAERHNISQCRRRDVR